MAGKTVTRVDLAKGISRKQGGLSKDDCRALLEDVLDRISETLARGESVKIANFGTFSVREKTARMGRNPKTGDEAPIAARKVLRFRASPMLKHWINHPEEIAQRRSN